MPALKKLTTAVKKLLQVHAHISQTAIVRLVSVFPVILPSFGRETVGNALEHLGAIKQKTQPDPLHVFEHRRGHLLLLYGRPQVDDERATPLHPNAARLERVGNPRQKFAERSAMLLGTGDVWIERNEKIFGVTIDAHKLQDRSSAKIEETEKALRSALQATPTTTVLSLIIMFYEPECLFKIVHEILLRRLFSAERRSMAALDTMSPLRFTIPSVSADDQLACIPAEIVRIIPAGTCGIGVFFGCLAHGKGDQPNEPSRRGGTGRGQDDVRKKLRERNIPGGERRKQGTPKLLPFSRKSCRKSLLFRKRDRPRGASGDRLREAGRQPESGNTAHRRGARGQSTGTDGMHGSAAQPRRDSPNEGGRQGKDKIF